MAKPLAEHLPAVTENSLEPVTSSLPSLSEAALALDLSSLPEELDNPTFALVREIASGPLPPLPMATVEELHQHLRVMDAALPRRAKDDVSGALMVKAYARMIGMRSSHELAFLSRTALEELDWFPTVKQCLAILARFERRDIHTRRRAEAKRIERHELERRRRRFFERLAAGEMSEDDIQRLVPIPVQLEAARMGILRWDQTAERYVRAGASSDEPPALSQPDVAREPDGQSPSSGKAPRARKGRR